MTIEEEDFKIMECFDLWKLTPLISQNCGGFCIIESISCFFFYQNGKAKGRQGIWQY